MQSRLFVGTDRVVAGREVDVKDLRRAVIRGYRRFLEWSLRHRVFTTFSMFVLLIGTFMVYGELNHGTEFFPDVEPDRATITIRAPDGTDLEETDRIVRAVEERLLAEPSAWEEVSFGEQADAPVSYGIPVAA